MVLAVTSDRPRHAYDHPGDGVYPPSCIWNEIVLTGNTTLGLLLEQETNRLSGCNKAGVMKKSLEASPCIGRRLHARRMARLSYADIINVNFQPPNTNSSSKMLMSYPLTYAAKDIELHPFEPAWCTEARRRLKSRENSGCAGL